MGLDFCPPPFPHAHGCPSTLTSSFRRSFDRGSSASSLTTRFASKLPNSNKCLRICPMFSSTTSRSSLLLSALALVSHHQSYPLGCMAAPCVFHLSHWPVALLHVLIGGGCRCSFWYCSRLSHILWLILERAHPVSPPLHLRSAFWSSMSASPRVSRYAGHPGVAPNFRISTSFLMRAHTSFRRQGGFCIDQHPGGDSSQLVYWRPV